MIYAAYYDESDEKPGFSVAGYSASYATWVQLDWKWQELLKKWNIQYFKASECENGLGQFSQFRDNPNDQRATLKPNERQRLKEVKTQFVDLICLHHDDLQGYGAAVVIEDFNRFVSEDTQARKRLLNSPYYICAQLCLVAAAMPARQANIHRDRYAQVSVKPIFDSHREYSEVAKIIFADFPAKNPRAAEVLLPPSYEDDKHSSPLQVADTLAYEVRKLLTRKIRNPNDDYMRIPYMRLRPSVYRIYKLDYKNLTILMSKQNHADSVPLSAVGEDQLGDNTGRTK